MQAFQFMQLSLLVNLYNQMCLNKRTTRIFPLVYAYLRLRSCHWRKSVAFPFKSFQDLWILKLYNSASPNVVFRCKSLSLPNGFAVLPSLAAMFFSSLEREMACLLSFPFLPCLPSYFSTELLFYNGISWAGRYFLHVQKCQMCCFWVWFHYLEVDLLSRW